MKFPNKLELCRYSDNTTINEVISLLGTSKNCGQYNTGKCGIDGKKCKVVVYTKEPEISYGIV